MSQEKFKPGDTVIFRRPPPGVEEGTIKAIWPGPRSGPQEPLYQVEIPGGSWVAAYESALRKKGEDE